MAPKVHETPIFSARTQKIKILVSNVINIEEKLKISVCFIFYVEEKLKIGVCPVFFASEQCLKSGVQHLTSYFGVWFFF